MLQPSDRSGFARKSLASLPGIEGVRGKDL